MAQIIKHRRGSLEALSSVTSSLQKGEIVIASGSSNLTTTNGTSLVFAVPENGQVQATNRFLIGDEAPNTFAGSTYNGLVKGVPYYASGSSTLYLLGSDGNDAINLEGNIQPFSASVATAINALSQSIGSGTIGQSVSALNTFSASVLTQLTEIGVVSGSLISSASAAAVSASAAAVSASTAATTNDTQDGRLDNLELTSASVNTSVSELNTFTASANISTTALNVFTASAESKFTEIGVVSGSLISSASAAKSTNDTQDGRLNNLESTSASVNTSVAALNSSSASQQISIDALNVVSGSLIDSASNANGRIGTLETFSSSFNNAFELTGSNVVVLGDFEVRGTTTTINSTTVAIGDNIIELNGSNVINGGLHITDVDSNNTGSLLWDSVNDYWKAGLHDSESKILLAGGDSVVSGSSQITLSDTTGYGDFSGSVSASIAAVVANVGSGVGVSIANLNSFSSSAITRLDNLEATDSDHESRIGVNEGDISTINGTLGDIDTAQGVQDGRLTSLETYTGSNDIRVGSVEGDVSDIFTAQGVQDDRLDSLEATSASVNTSVAALNSSSASQQTQLDSLSGQTGSYATTGSNVFVGTQTISASFNVSGSSNFNGAVAVDNSNVNLGNSSALNLTGGSSIYVDGAGVISGSIVGIGNVTAFSTSVDSRFTNLESKSASVDTAIAALNSFTSSNSSTTALNAFTASANGRLDNLESFSSSVNSTLDGIATDQSTQDGRIAVLEGSGVIQGVGQSDEVVFAKVTTSGDVIIGGDLVVQGNTVTLNTSQLVVEDKLITLASGSTSNATADGAGFEVAGTTASFKYDGIANTFSSSVDIVANTTGSVNLGSAAGNSKRVAFRNTNGNLDLVPTASVAGDLLQWDGTDFVMSNTIDGGSF